MTTTVQVSDDGGSTWRDIAHSDIDIVLGTSDVQVVPESNVVTHARESVSADQPYRVQVDGTTEFEGKTVSAGTVRQNGQMDVTARHDASSVFSEVVDLVVGDDPTDEDEEPTDEDVLISALAGSGEGQSYTLTYNATPVLLTDESTYEVSNRAVKQIFRDMVDRRNFVWWVKPTGEEIVVEPRGNQGTWMSLTAASDGVEIRNFDQGSVDNVRNDVRIVGTGAEPRAEGHAEDSTSINTYGRQSEVYNVAYVTEVAEATDHAESLLITDPPVSAEIRVPTSTGTITDPLVNYTVDIQDDSKNIDESGLVVERQTIEQRRATLAVGQGAGEPIANTNRKTKSAEDKQTGDTASAGSSPTGTLQQWDKIDNTELQNGEFISFRFRIPAGKTLKVWAAGAQNASNSAPAGLTAEVDDETNSTNLVSENGKLTTGSPLGSVTGPVDVAFRVENDTGSTQRATGQFRYSL